jgi:hypothetical protein
VRIEARRKVCGFWGCQYKTKAKVDWQKVQGAGDHHFGVDQPCVAGTHRYQTVVSIMWTVLNSETGKDSRRAESEAVEFTCPKEFGPVPPPNWEKKGP